MSIAQNLSPPPPPTEALTSSRELASQAPDPEVLIRSMAMEEGLLDAVSSEELLRAVLDFLATTFNAAGFFLVQGALIVGREAVGDPVLARLVMPARSATIFGRVASTRRPFFGPIPPHLQDSYIHERTHRPLPAEVLCVPVVIEGSCVGLIYADRLEPGAPIDPSLPHRLGRMVAAAFLDLFARDLEGTLANSRVEEKDRDEDEDEQSATHEVRALAQALPSDHGLIDRVAKLGEAAVGALIDHFPGRIDETALTDPDREACGEGHSALMEATVKMGSVGVTVALAALSDSNPLRRRYGALLFRRLPSAQAIPALLALLADPIPEVADAAVLALQTTRDGPNTRSVLERILPELGSDRCVETRQKRHLLRVAGALGAIAAIDDARAALDDAQLAEAADFALRQICFVTPRGRNRARAWERWLAERHDRGPMARKRFAVEALEDSAEEDRLAAITWLRRVTRHYFGYAHDASGRERSTIAAQWGAALSL